MKQSMWKYWVNSEGGRSDLICDFRLMNVDKQFSDIRTECQKQHIRKTRTRFTYVKKNNY